MPPFTRLAIPGPLLEEVIAHAREPAPLECCGLLAGRIENGIGLATARFAITNDLHSPTRYATNPRDLFDAFRAMRKDNLELLAIYHSHPTSDPVPSRRDVEENTYGQSVVHLIVGLAGEKPAVRAWWLTESGYREAEWVIGS
jgi:[CysO sulfur-carrier protein]-S-L-cysteine hydrolase